MNTKDLGEIQVSYKYKSGIQNRFKITNSSEAFKASMCVFNKHSLSIQEQFVVLYLNNSNTIIGVRNMFSGTQTGTMVDLKLVVAVGIKLFSSGVIIAHNHPSGNLKPSNNDISLTTRLKIALELYNIKLLDHLIVSPHNKYVSLEDEGYMSTLCTGGCTLSNLFKYV
ncbi:MAG: JAB domain-containing protein [Bacteroidales bacterium]|nr:JAB domain-containing protein [Bacteroidales bacterium]